MRRDGEHTKQLLVNAALQCFADRGIAATSLKEIVNAANQRNVSVLHYYFGSREELLRAVLHRYWAVIREKREELIVHAHESGTARAAAEAFVIPLGILLANDRQARCFLQIVADLSADPTRTLPAISALTGDTAAQEANELVLASMHSVPEPLRKLRLRIANMMVLHALADQARALNAQKTADGPDRIRVYVTNLVDMYLGALGCPDNETSTLISSNVSAAR
jgi:AcrR family transcriptional regulator